MFVLWAAEAIIREEYPDLTPNDFLLEPTCGNGSFLGAIPKDVPCLGVEIDAALAAIARTRTGRDVVVGDIRTVPLDIKPTVVLGNPPFRNDLIEAILNRIHGMLPQGGRVGFVLPAGLYSDSARVCRLNEHWSLEQKMIPRYLYPRLSVPLVFGSFRKDDMRRMIGFALYYEMEGVRRIPPGLRRFLLEGKTEPWRNLVAEVLRLVGRPATIDEVMAYVDPLSEKFRPENRFPRDTVRRVLGEHFRRIENGRFGLPEAA